MGNKDNETKLKRLLTVKEAAAYLGLSTKTLYNQSAPNAEKRFPIKPKRIGRKVLWDIRDLDRYIEML
jgi:predicted DNA-binding transcriptional regulator AlpA